MEDIKKLAWDKAVIIYPAQNQGSYDPKINQKTREVYSRGFIEGHSYEKSKLGMMLYHMKKEMYARGQFIASELIQDKIDSMT